MLLLENLFLQQYFFAVVQTSRLPTQPRGQTTLTARTRQQGMVNGEWVSAAYCTLELSDVGEQTEIATGTVAPLFNPQAFPSVKATTL
jgi:hypothetical protein